MSRKGFTLLETVISLAILCSLTAISIYNLKNYQANMEEQQAIEWFKNTFKGKFNYSYLSHRATTMIFEKNIVKFDTDMGNKTKSVYRKLPETLTVTENYSHKYIIYGTGNAPAVTITFTSELTHRKYRYEVQLAWGEIIEKKDTT